MSGLLYYLVYGFLYLFSLLPFPVLYGISDVVAFFMYHVIKYRKNVVFANLAIAFPEKTREEHAAIARKFYRNFTDNFIETVKLLSLSEKALHKRFTGNYHETGAYYAGGRNVQIHLGHFFNWEYANLAFSYSSVYPVLTVYKPITSKISDRLVKTIRTRFGAKLISERNFLRDFLPFSKERYALLLVADQRASIRRAYWLPFFGIRAPFVTGPEKNARLNNTVVMYAELCRLKRGHYQVILTELTTDARSLAEGELTKKYIVLLEQSIRENPENYMWTHNRWKHKFDPGKHRAY